jgi:hypothetical protein
LSSLPPPAAVPPVAEMVLASAAISAKTKTAAVMIGR